MALRTVSADVLVIGGGSYVVAPSSKSAPKIYAMIHADQVEAYNLPLGVLMHLRTPGHRRQEARNDHQGRAEDLRRSTRRGWAYEQDYTF